MTILHVDSSGNAIGLANASDGSLPTDLLAIEGSNQPPSSVGSDISFASLETNSAFLTGTENGIFTVDQNDWIYVDFLLDGGSYQGQVGFFSLAEMAQYYNDLDAFTAEAIDRVTGDDPSLGGIVINDHQHGARFGGDFEEYEARNWDKGAPDEVKGFYLGAGTQFAFVLMPDGTFEGSKADPLFSIAEANPRREVHFTDVTGDGLIFSIEDLQSDHVWADQDYNDIVFALKGASGNVNPFESVADSTQDWRDSDSGQQATQYYFDPRDFLSTTPGGAKYKPGELNLKIDPDLIDIKNLEKTLGALGAKRTLPDAQPSELGLHNLWTLQFKPDIDLIPIYESLQSEQGILSVGFNELVIADAPQQAPPNDPLYTSANNDDFWGLEAIEAPQAWTYQTGNANVKVAVLDTGIDYNHDDLKGNIWTGRDQNNQPYHGKSFLNGVETNNPLETSNSHGNLVSGIIGAVGYNGKGLLGSSPEVTLLGVKALSNNLLGSGTDPSVSYGWMNDVANGIIFAANQDVDIINASFSSVYDPNSSPNDSDNAETLKDSIAYASDTLFVTSAGQSFNTSDNNFEPGQNIDTGYFYPSRFDLNNIVSVTATVENPDGEEIAQRSSSGTIVVNYGPQTVHLAAPGTTQSTIGGNQYGPAEKHFTSYAAAFVSGAAAVLLAENPTLSPEDLKDILMETGDSLPSLSDTTISGNRLNLRQAVLDPRVNVQPQATNLNTPQAYTEDTPLDLEDIVITDLDSFVEQVTLQLSDPAAGRLSTPAVGTAAATFDASTGLWSATGDLDDINAVLAQLEFLPTLNLSGDLSIDVTLEDNISDAITGTIDLTGIAVNDPPDNISLSNSSVTENTPGDILGTLSATDVDSESFTFSVDDSRFEIVDNQLKLKDDENLDFEAEPQITLNITVEDDGTPAASRTQELTFDVLNAEVPADLSGLEFNVVQEPLDAGDSFNVEFRLQNTGNGDAGPFTVDFYISTNDFISTNDQKLGSYTVSSLIDNSISEEFNLQLQLPARGSSFWLTQGDGQYHIGMVVDSGNSVTETSESNNQNNGEFADYDGLLLDDTLLNVYSHSADFTDFTQTIEERWEDGFDLIDVEYGNGTWFGVFNQSNERQGFFNRNDFTDFTQTIEEWWEDGFDLIDVEYGNGTWFGVFNQSNERQGFFNRNDFTDFTQTIEEWWEDGF
ncbi:MAG: S8 family serine peptidase, partial [Cyanobacteria bacterium P01_D01_bin.156]